MVYLEGDPRKHLCGGGKREGQEVSIGFVIDQEAVDKRGALSLGMNGRLCRTTAELSHLRREEVEASMPQLPSVAAPGSTGSPHFQPALCTG